MIETAARLAPGDWYRRLLVKDSAMRYETGRWDYLGDLAESHRYSAIVGCAEAILPRRPRVLDVGCGDGILQQRLAYERYLGIDASPEAIATARDREGERTAFLCADAQDVALDGEFDLIVFNESLYYLPEPIEALAHYRRSLAPGGVIVVSIVETPISARLWRRLEASGLGMVTSVRVTNEHGRTSRVAAFAELAAALPACAARVA